MPASEMPANEISVSSEASSGDQLGLPERFLHLFALWGFAVAQPLFDLLGRNAQFLVAHDARPLEVIALTAMLCFAGPGLLTVTEWMADRVSPTAGRWFHQLLVALLAGATILQAVKSLGDLPGMLWVGVAGVAGVGVSWAYQRMVPIRTYLSILALAPLVFALIFLFSSQVSPLLWPEDRSFSKFGKPAQRHPIVLVVFDELSLPTLMDRTHRIDPMRYPAFASLASRSHWFRNATATADNTVLALPAILTGRYLAEGQHKDIPPATASNYPQNLFTLLGGSYRLQAFEHLTELCPEELCGRGETEPVATRARALSSDLWVVYLHRLLPIDLAEDLPPIDLQWGHFNEAIEERRPRVKKSWVGAGGRKVEIFSAFRDAVGAGAREQSLHFLHSGLPHVPWRFLPSGKNYGTRRGRLINNPGLKRGRWTQDPWPVLQAFQRYLLQQAFVDRLLGDLLRTLREHGLFDRALLIVTADHGVSFQPGRPRRRVGRQTFADVMSVPLFIKLPDQRSGTISDRNVELVDILPTIVDVLGLEEPWPMDGLSVFDDTLAERPKKHVFRDFGPEDHWTISAAEMDAKYEIVERIFEIFGPSSDPLAFYRIGPAPGLVGRPLSEIEIGRPSRYQARLRASEIFADVDPGGDFIPSRVIGHIRGRKLGRGPLKLAVTVGDTVWATTYTLKGKDGMAPFSAMVPEQAFVAGQNRVGVWVMEGPPERPRLLPTVLGKR